MISNIETIDDNIFVHYASNIGNSDGDDNDKPYVEQPNDHETNVL